MPLGVVAVVYEARPNVTIDAAALCLKSGNAIVLRGSSSAAHSNAVLAGVAREAAEAAGLPAGALALVAGGGREELAELAGQEGVVDLIIPRGGEGLKKALSGGREGPGDLRRVGQLPRLRRRERRPRRRASAIVLNAKTQRPGVCNAAETLLVHADVAAAFLPRALRALRDGRCRAARATTARAGCRRRRRRSPRRPRRTAPRSSSRSCSRSGRRLGGGGDRARQRLRLRPLGGDRHRATRRPRGRSSSASTPPASTSTPPPASPTAASSGWAPRSATRRRSCTPAARSGCASCARSSTWSRARARSGP